MLLKNVVLEAIEIYFFTEQILAFVHERAKHIYIENEENSHSTVET